MQRIFIRGIRKTQIGIIEDRLAKDHVSAVQSGIVSATDTLINDTAGHKV